MERWSTCSSCHANSPRSKSGLSADRSAARCRPATRPRRGDRPPHRRYAPVPPRQSTPICRLRWPATDLARRSAEDYRFVSWPLPAQPDGEHVRFVVAVAVSVGGARAALGVRADSSYRYSIHRVRVVSRPIQLSSPVRAEPCGRPKLLRASQDATGFDCLDAVRERLT